MKKETNIFNTQKFESLQAIVYWMDGLKTLWYQAELAKNLNHNLFAAAEKLHADLDYLANTGTFPSWMKLAETVPEDENAYVTLPDDHPLAGEIQAFMAESTDDYPWWISFGAFWNEIQTPAFLMELMNQLGRFYAANPDTHCLGSEYDAADKTVSGCGGIAFYDVGDEMLVFDSFEAADKFSDENPVDPMDLMVFTGIGWQCT